MATIEKRLKSDGTTHYRVKVRLKGTPLQTESFVRLTDARRWAQSTEASIREGRHFGAQDVGAGLKLSICAGLKLTRRLNDVVYYCVLSEKRPPIII